TTDAKGVYTVTVDPAKSFNMVVEKAGYYTLTEQETLVKASIDLGKTSFLSDSTANLLTLTLQVPGATYDPALGIVSVGVEPKLHASKKALCADIGGATLDYTVDGKPGAQSTAKLIYTQGGQPSVGQTSVDKDSAPASAVLFNVPPGKPVTITVKHPTCK